MAVDTPARIAVLGAGPTGLEAALYARFLGYEVDVYERGGICENVLNWGHVRLFSPFRLNRSTLGLSAIRAQTHDWVPPDDEALLTGRETVEQYLRPLAETDLLAGSVHEQTEVLAIGRAGSLKGDLVGDDSRSDTSFRILTRGARGEERVGSADVVIDAQQRVYVASSSGLVVYRYDGDWPTEASFPVAGEMDVWIMGGTGALQGTYSLSGGVVSQSAYPGT